MKQPGNAYITLARSRRPKAFAEIVGQEAAVKVLRESVARKRLAHAILFAGPRGIGKTTIARILAKCLNCAAGITPEPCNACDTCVRIDKGTCADVLEIDAASNRSIEDVRTLKELLRYAPYQARARVVILDEVHMLTQEAFNALLKSLEEPPPNAYFVLATTEADKLPKTIVSRCQRFHLAPIPQALAAEHLARVAQEEEGVSLSAEVLGRIALRAQGSLRDGLILLEEVLGLKAAGGSIEEIEALLGFGTEAVVVAMMERIACHDAAGAMKEIDALMMKGVDPGGFYESLAFMLRNMLAYALTGNTHALVGGPSPEALERLSGTFEPEQLVELLHMFLEAEQTLLRSRNPRLVLETLLVRASFVPNVALLSKMLEVLDVSKEDRPAVNNGGDTAPHIGVDEAYKGRASKEPEQTPPPERKTTEGFLEGLEQTNPILAHTLQTLGTLKTEGSTVIFQPAQDGFLYERLRQPKAIREVEEALKAYFGKSLAFRLLQVPAEPINAHAEPRQVPEEQPLGFDEAVRLAAEVFKAEILEDEDKQEESLEEL